MTPCVRDAAVNAREYGLATAAVADYSAHRASRRDRVREARVSLARLKRWGAVTTVDVIIDSGTALFIRTGEALYRIGGSR